jgi:hypothetical protein
MLVMDEVAGNPRHIATKIPRWRAAFFCFGWSEKFARKWSEVAA